MIIWGKILGAIFGFMVGGVFGAILGIILGHSFDTGFSYNYINFGSAKLQQVKSDFFETTFAVMGHLARSDGAVTNAEINMASKLMDEMQL